MLLGVGGGAASHSRSEPRSDGETTGTPGMAARTRGYVGTMAKPQQAELRRSGKVPALDPDASVSKLSAQETPSVSGPDGTIPEDQRPGHHPDHEQDKPDLDKFAARLGIVSDEELPPEAPHVEEDSKVTRLKPAKARTEQATPAATTSRPTDERRTFSPIGLALVGPVTGVLIAKKVFDRLKQLRS